MDATDTNPEVEEQKVPINEHQDLDSGKFTSISKSYPELDDEEEDDEMLEGEGEEDDGEEDEDDDEEEDEDEQDANG